jgi:zinc protease
MVPPVLDETKLTNGVRVAVVERHAAPVVSIELSIARANGASAAGRDLLAGLLLSSPSTGGASARSVLESLGAAFVSESNIDGTRLAITTTPDALERVLAVLADVLMKPAFSKDAFPVQHDAMTSRAARAEETDEVRNLAADSILPAGHPYKLPVHADAATAKRATLDEATRTAQLSLKPDATTLLFVGDVTKKDLADKLESRLSAWKGKATLPPPTASEKLAHGVFLGQVKDDTRAEIAIVAPAVARSSRDYAAVLLLQQMLLSDLWSHLGMVRGSTGVQAAVLEANAYAGLWLNVIDVDSDAVGAATEQLLGTMERIRAGEISDERFEAIRAQQVERLEDKLDQTPDTALLVATALSDRVSADETTKLHDRLLSLSKEDLRAAAQTYLKKEELRLVVVVDVVAQKKELEALKLGPITVRTLVRPKTEPSAAKATFGGLGLIGVLRSGPETPAPKKKK